MNPTAGAAEERIDPRRLLAFLAMIFGMFMAILDIQIVAASLVEIQAGLSASADEIAYVQTSYLIAEVIMIPLSGFLARIMSTRILFTIAAAGFTASSMLCGMATSIEEMVVFRALQGFIGGAMIPTTFAASFAMFPMSKRHIVMPVMGLVVPLAPTVGPTVGGLLTDMFSWHWLFYVNLVPGIGVTIAAWTLIDYDQPNWGLFRKTDWLGLFAMAGFLGTVEYVLEEGPSKDWFADETLCWTAAAAVVIGIAFFWRAFRAEVPIVDLRAFANRNFALGSFYSLVMGCGLFGLTYLYPLYLARIRGFTPLQIGETMFVTGACMFLTAPIASRLVARTDPRAMLLFGFSCFAASTWMLTSITKDWDFWELLVPQVLRGVSLMFCMIPINNLALGTLPLDRLKNASGLFNLMRNLGGALGLALINTILNQRLDLHLARLREQVVWGRGVAVETLANMTTRFSDAGGDAQAMALRRLGEMVRREAMVMSFADVFMLLSLLVGAMIALIALMRRPAPAMRRA